MPSPSDRRGFPGRRAPAPESRHDCNTPATARETTATSSYPIGHQSRQKNRRQSKAPHPGAAQSSLIGKPGPSNLSERASGRGDQPTQRSRLCYARHAGRSQASRLFQDQTNAYSGSTSVLGQTGPKHNHFFFPVLLPCHRLIWRIRHHFYTLGP